jgi:hypothetical protein
MPLYFLECRQTSADGCERASAVHAPQRALSAMLRAACAHAATALFMPTFAADARSAMFRRYADV